MAMLTEDVLGLVSPFSCTPISDFSYSERVVTGQPLGRAGNSGRSGAPHLQMHLQDSPEFNGGEGIPLEFCNYMVYDFGGDPKSAKLVERGMLTGRLRKQVVRH